MFLLSLYSKEVVDVTGKPLFFTKGDLAGEVILQEEEARHCIVSLRMKEGNTVFLTNGRGSVAEGIIVKANSKAPVLRILKSEVRPRVGVWRRLCVAPPKTADRLDWMIEKAVEIGVDEIVLIETRNSERDKVNLERLEKIAIAAIKQSKQFHLPLISGIIKWSQFINKAITGKNFIAHVSKGVNKINLSDALTETMGSVSLLIGPEGDFTMEEVETAVSKGYLRVSLGNNVLRTETAVLSALAVINSLIVKTDESI